MTESLFVTVLLTVLFAGVAGYHLRRCAGHWADGPRPGQERAAHLAHLLMSLAMIGMTWAWGGPAARWLQIGVFGVLALYFLAHVATRLRLVTGYHALSMAAMTWMVAAMPLLGHAHFASSGGSGHSHGAAAAAGAAPGAGAAQPWAVAVTAGLAAVFAFCAVAWIAATARTRAPVSAGVGAARRPDDREPHPRAEGWSHVLMSLGMAGMLLVMV